MNLDDKNIIDADDELFLNRMSSYFRRDRERVIFQDMVSNKIAATDFKSMSNIRNGNSGFSKFWFILFSVFMLSTLMYFIYSDNLIDTNKNHVKIGSNINSNNSSNEIDAEKDKSYINSQSIYENLPNRKVGTSVIDQNEKRNKDKGSLTQTTAIKGIEGNNKKSLLVSSETEIEQINELHGKQRTASAKISEDTDKVELKKEIASLLINLGYILDKNIAGNDYLEIRTRNVTALSESGNQVEYNINFKINKKNPALLKIYMDFYILKEMTNDPNTNLSDNNNVMEDMFDKIEKGLDKILKKFNAS